MIHLLLVGLAVFADAFFVTLGIIMLFLMIHSYVYSREE